METLATVSSLTVCYSDLLAVNDVSFEVCATEILAVIGPNGSGKTTMVECLEGLRRPTSGKVDVFGMNPHFQRERVYAEMGVQLQEVHYPDKIKVGELCALFAAFYKNPADWRNLLEQLGLTPKLNKYVSRLSGGEKQRLSILLAMLPKPKLLVLDELTTGLDPEVRRSLWTSLKAVRESGTGILLVSHYMDEVEALADRILFMVQGKPIYTGTLEGLRNYAQKTLAPDVWREEMTLEDIYLALVPQKGAITLEVPQ